MKNFHGGGVLHHFGVVLLEQLGFDESSVVLADTVSVDFLVSIDNAVFEREKLVLGFDVIFFAK